MFIKQLKSASTKLLLTVVTIFSLSAYSFAATIPDDVQKLIAKDFPKTTFRFDGVIILPDNTIYLPLFPAKILNPETLAIKQTYPDH